MSMCLGGYSRSARAAEDGVALRQEVAIGLEVVGARYVDTPALKALEAMLKHRPVDFVQHVEAHGDLEVGRDADEVAVEGGVVELAEREAVGNARLPQGMAVREDVSGFQQLVMAEPADGAALLVGAEHALAKAPLVQALADHRSHVLPPRGQRRRVVELPGGRRPDVVIDRHDKAQRFGMVLDDEDRPSLEAIRLTRRPLCDELSYRRHQIDRHLHGGVGGCLIRGFVFRDRFLIQLRLVVLQDVTNALRIPAVGIVRLRHDFLLRRRRSALVALAPSGYAVITKTESGTVSDGDAANHFSSPRSV